MNQNLYLSNYAYITAHLQRDGHATSKKLLYDGGSNSWDLSF